MLSLLTSLCVTVRKGEADDDDQWKEDGGGWGHDNASPSQ